MKLLTSENSKAWLVLLGMQALVVLAIFSKFFSGQFYFAYFDIGSDSYFQVLPDAIHMARKLAAEGFTGWSFEFGLGGPTALLIGDPFSLLGMAGGPENVIALRIWIYVLKIMLGGISFFLLIRSCVLRQEAAVITALAYSFCGFVVVNGQWDLEATEFVFFPLTLWAIIKYLRTGSLIAVPFAVATTLIFGVFFVSTGVFLVFTACAFIMLSGSPKDMAKTWLVKLLPLIVIGYLLAAPRLLPIILQILDSSRVSGGDAIFQKVVNESFSINSESLILAQIGGLFHKDIFGIGSAYKGYWNYLEGPEFFIGITLLILIPQLWRGTRTDRKLLVIGIGAIAAYVVFPVFRNAAMGFAAPYFRVSTLWISLILLMLSARAVDLVLEHGVKGLPLLTGAGLFGCLLISVVVTLSDHVALLHVIKLVVLALLGGGILWLTQMKIVSARLLPLLLLGVIAAEAVLISRPSYIEGRGLVTPEIHALAYNDGTLEALAAIRKMDKGVFRIEKTYDSVSLADSLAQNYMGIKSYFLHSRGVVDFNMGMGLVPHSEVQGVNYTNWIPNVGQRFILNSLLGVKYMISKVPLAWPGFVKVAETSGMLIYRNDFALPLALVQTRQITKTALRDAVSSAGQDADTIRDLAVINSVVVEHFLTNHGEPMNSEELARIKMASLEVSYLRPALTLKATGMKLEEFSSSHLAGTISPDKAGILTFTIPFSAGWTLKIDGEISPLIRTNFGMLGTPVRAGRQRVELDFLLPGQRLGTLLGLAAGCFFGIFLALDLRRKKMKLNNFSCSFMIL